MHVAAGALVDRDGAVLLARRHTDTHQGGLWEFPGGKLEPDEAVVDGLARELREELGIEPLTHRPLIRIRHDYADRAVLLDVHRVTAWRGEPRGLEGQPLAWVRPEQLDEYAMPAADRPVVRALQLPSRYVITPPRIGDGAVFMRDLAAVLDAGARLLQLRLFDLADEELLRIGADFCRACHTRGARVLLNGEASLAAAIGADGVHLSSRRLRTMARRGPSFDGLLGVSCHAADDLRHAEAVGADFALLSPVLPTPSHPDAEPLGWARFGEWVDRARLPVYALGGMRGDLIPTAWAHGAQGVAGIRGLWRGNEADDAASG